MSRILAILLFTIGIGFTSSVTAQQSGGGIEGLDGVCSMSGGEWTSTSSGNWACCWADWGCYGCVNGVCKIKCTTQRCRKANAIGKAQKDEAKVKGLAPKGMKAPIAPKKSNAPTQQKAPATNVH